MPVKIINNFGLVRENIKGATVAAQDRLAERTAQYAKEDAPVDTGFYRDNIIALTSASSGRPGFTEKRVNREGKLVTRVAVDAGGVQIGSAAVLAQAKYSIWVELDRHVIFTASQRANADFPEIVAQVREDFLLGR